MGWPRASRPVKQSTPPDTGQTLKRGWDKPLYTPIKRRPWWEPFPLARPPTISEGAGLERTDQALPEGLSLLTINQLSIAIRLIIGWRMVYYH